MCVCVHTRDMLALALPSVRVCRVHERVGGRALGCPRPERALLDRVTLNIRTAHVPHHSLAAASTYVRRYPGLALLERAISRREISDVPIPPHEFTADKYMTGTFAVAVLGE